MLRSHRLENEEDGISDHKRKEKTAGAARLVGHNGKSHGGLAK
jgi:hypothetical protein